MSNVEFHRFSESMNTDLENVNKTIEVIVEDEIFALVALAERWSRHTDKESWSREVLKITEHYGFKAIGRVDGTIVKWVVPLEGNENVVDLDLSFEKKRRVALEEAATTKTPKIAGPIELVQGGYGVLIAAPIYEDGKHIGFMTGAVEADFVFKKAFFNAPYNIEIKSEGKELYKKGNNIGESRTSKVTVNGFNFNIKIYKELKSVQNAISGLGFLLSVVFCFFFDYVLKDFANGFCKKK